VTSSHVIRHDARCRREPTGPVLTDRRTRSMSRGPPMGSLAFLGPPVRSWRSRGEETGLQGETVGHPYRLWQLSGRAGRRSSGLGGFDEAPARRAGAARRRRCARRRGFPAAPGDQADAWGPVAKAPLLPGQQRLDQLPQLLGNDPRRGGHRHPSQLDDGCRRPSPSRGRVPAVAGDRWRQSGAARVRNQRDQKAPNAAGSWR
jgi:hypothetical protein